MIVLSGHGAELETENEDQWDLHFLSPAARDTSAEEFRRNGVSLSSIIQLVRNVESQQPTGAQYLGVQLLIICDSCRVKISLHDRKAVSDFDKPRGFAAASAAGGRFVALNRFGGVATCTERSTVDGKGSEDGDWLDEEATWHQGRQWSDANALVRGQVYQSHRFPAMNCTEEIGPTAGSGNCPVFFVYPVPSGEFADDQSRLAEALFHMIATPGVPIATILQKIKHKVPEIDLKDELGSDWLHRISLVDGVFLCCTSPQAHLAANDIRIHLQKRGIKVEAPSCDAKHQSNAIEHCSLVAFVFTDDCLDEDELPRNKTLFRQLYEKVLDVKRFRGEPFRITQCKLSRIDTEWNSGNTISAQDHRLHEMARKLVLFSIDRNSQEQVMDTGAELARMHFYCSREKVGASGRWRKIGRGPHSQMRHDPHSSAISLKKLLEFTRSEVWRVWPTDGQYRPTIRDVIQQIVKPQTCESKYAYAEVVGDEHRGSRGKQMIVVSCGWNDEWELMVAALLDGRQSCTHQEWYVWHPAFAVNQHSGAGPEADMPQDDMEDAKQAVKVCKYVTIVIGVPSPDNITVEPDRRSALLQPTDIYSFYFAAKWKKTIFVRIGDWKIGTEHDRPFIFRPPKFLPQVSDPKRDACVSKTRVPLQDLKPFFRHGNYRQAKIYDTIEKGGGFKVVQFKLIASVDAGLYGPNLEALTQAVLDPENIPQDKLEDFDPVYGRPPLYFAAEAGMQGPMRALLKAGANPKAKNQQGKPTIVAAAEQGNAKGVKLLVMHGEDVNAPHSFNGIPPIRAAAAHDTTTAVDTIKMLCRLRADINKEDNFKETALSSALKHCKPGSEVVKTLYGLSAKLPAGED